MAVHAHPDDESSKGAATTARYAAEGHEVMVLTLTGGERGDILNRPWTFPVSAIESAKFARRRWPRPLASWA